MATSTGEKTKILLILGPTRPNRDLTSRKLSETAAKMDDRWKVFALKGNLPKHFTEGLRIPFPCEFHSVSVFSSRKSVVSRVLYLLNCVLRGVRLVKEERIHVITQHDGHLEYGMVAYIVSRLTHRKCLIRVNEDTSIPLVLFLKSSGNYLFKSKTLLKIVASTYRKAEHIFFKHVDRVRKNMVRWITNRSETLRIELASFARAESRIAWMEES